MAKKLGLGLSLAIVAIAAAFVVPGLSERESAVGSLAKLSPELRRAFSADDDFLPLPEPGPGDWLSSYNEPGQTYGQFLKSKPNKPGAGGRKLIYLQPLGEFPEGTLALDDLQEYMEAYFHPMPVKVEEPLKVRTGKKMRSRDNMGRRQWNCKDLLTLLQRRVPQDAHVVMGITMTDLYPSDDWNFVFGMARIKKRVGVFSFARYGDDPKVSLKRAMKVISHETGHAFGIRHCTHYHCLMNGSNSLDEVDRAPMHFCPVCLRKIYWGLKFDPVERYQKLGSVLEDKEMADSAWFSSRAEKISAKRKK